MEQPCGFEKKDPARVNWKLIKALYGLKQACQEELAMIDEFYLGTSRIHRNTADECMYARQDHCRMLDIALYVENQLIACEQDSTIPKTKNQWCCPFDMKDSGNRV